METRLERRVLNNFVLYEQHYCLILYTLYMMFHIKNCFQFSVDFTKYPIFHEVEFHEAKMESGDCLFIPFKWYACFIMICILYKCHTSCLVCHFCFGPPPVHVVFLRVNTLRENPTHTGLLLFSGITK